MRTVKRVNLIMGALVCLIPQGCARGPEAGTAAAARPHELSGQPRVSPERLGALRSELGSQADLLLDSLTRAHPGWPSGSRRIALVDRFPSADSLFLAALLEKLRARRIEVAAGAADSLVILEDGGIALRTGGREARIDSAIPSRPILAAELEWDISGYTYLAARPEFQGGKPIAPAVWDRRAFAKPLADSIPRMDQQILWAVERGLPEAYARPDFAVLRRIFQGQGPCILTGNVVGNADEGKERVEYRWLEAKEYLDRLEAKSRQGVRFQADLTLMNLYRDLSDDFGNRYWGIVRQGWAAKSKSGRVLYRDDGFLFINFDFGKDGRVSEFRILYRLWFHNYRGKQFETGLDRWQRLEADISGILGGSAGRDPAMPRLGIMDSLLVAKMGSDLTGAIRSACCPAGEPTRGANGKRK